MDMIAQEPVGRVAAQRSLQVVGALLHGVGRAGLDQIPYRHDSAMGNRCWPRHGESGMDRNWPATLVSHDRVAICLAPSVMSEAQDW